MFNPKLHYFGIDISRSRLSSAFSIKRSSDFLFYGDITKPLGLASCFDIVVSCNTLSHLPDSQQILALKQLIQCCKQDSHFIFNCSVDSNLFSIFQLLIENFYDIEPIYFNSYLSFNAESQNKINSSNVAQLLPIYETNLANDACLHKGVIFHCRKLRDTSSLQPTNLSKFNASKIIQLNHVPNIKLLEFSSDALFLQSLDDMSSQTCTFFLSSKLFNSICGAEICRQLKHLSVTSFVLNEFSHEKKINQYVYILGLENEWSDDLAKDRIYVNTLREIPTVRIRFVYIRNRCDAPLTASLLLSDL
jgi:hypothetical protein